MGTLLRLVLGGKMSLATVVVVVDGPTSVRKGREFPFGPPGVPLHRCTAKNLVSNATAELLAAKFGKNSEILGVDRHGCLFCHAVCRRLNFVCFLSPIDLVRTGTS